MPNFDNINFCTVEDVKQMGAIGDLVDGQKIDPPLRPAGIQVQRVLGDALTEAFKTVIQNANIVVSITAVNPPVVATAKPHGYTTGDIVAIDHPKGMIDSEGSYRAVVVSPTTFQLWTIPTTSTASTAWDATGWGSYTTRSGVTFKMSVIRYKAFVRTRQLQAMIAYRLALSNIAASKANSGVMEPFGASMRPVKEDALARMRNEAQNEANQYGADLAKLICDNPSEFPETQTPNDNRPNTRGTTKLFGTFMDGPSPRISWTDTLE